MLRRALIATLALGLVGWLVGSPTASAPALLAQTEGESQDPESATGEAVEMPVISLELGQRFGLDGWDLEVQDIFMEESPRRTGYDEVRVSVAFRTISQPLPYLFDALTGVEGFPMLQLRDAAGEVWASPVVRPASNTFPGSALHTVELGIPAHWTAGFDVPQSASDAMSVEAVWNGNVVASWDLTSSPSAPAGWDSPPGVNDGLPGDTIEWSDDLDLTIVGQALLVCGDPQVERVTTMYFVVVEVENLTDRDALFPDVRYPDSVGTAVWADGTSGRYVGPLDFSDSDDELMSLNTRNLEQLIVPPRMTVELSLIFAVPRDSRLVDPGQPPSSVLLGTAGGESWWFAVGDQQLEVLDTDICGAISGSVPFSIGIPEGVVVAPPISGDV